jgi:hypothetical protein
MLLSTIVVAAAVCCPVAVRAQEEPAGDVEKHEAPSDPASPENICQVLAAAAASNDLPVEFFTRLIWQESRFRPEAVSRAGAQGVAQFMPATAKLRGLENPFDPLESITKSAELLRDLHREFGNLGLAAAAYNAGSGRVRDWLSGRRALPGETQAYVRLVTGHAAEEWMAAQKNLPDGGTAITVPCTIVAVLTDPTLRPPVPKPEPLKPWGAEVAGGPTKAKALARYREVQGKYPTILAGHEPHFVVRGIIGDMGAVRARVGAETRADAAKVCAALRAVDWYCDVLRN